MNETYKAYLAGFFDGEGCVSILRQRQSGMISMKYRVFVSITQNDKDSLDEISKELGYGKIYKVGTGFQLHFTGTKAVEFLSLILPYIRLKKNETFLALEFYDKTKWSRSERGVIIDDQMNALREYYWIKIRSLKRNGLNERRGRPLKIK